MPAGELITLPVPEPARDTVSNGVDMNVATTF
jgi:hypothetical protein